MPGVNYEYMAAPLREQLHEYHYAEFKALLELLLKIG